MTYTAFLVGLSPILIALIRTQAWAAGRVAVLAVGWAVLAYVGGRYLDGVVPSLALDYLQGFVLAVAGQQSLYQLLKGTDWFQWLEGVGNPRGALAQPRVGNKGWGE